MAVSLFNQPASLATLQSLLAENTALKEKIVELTQKAGLLEQLYLNARKHVSNLKEEVKFLETSNDTLLDRMAKHDELTHELCDKTLELEKAKAELTNAGPVKLEKERRKFLGLLEDAQITLETTVFLHDMKLGQCSREKDGLMARMKEMQKEIDVLKTQLLAVEDENQVLLHQREELDEVFAGEMRHIWPGSRKSERDEDGHVHGRSFIVIE
jgi:chromosome segregation ATPase